MNSLNNRLPHNRWIIWLTLFVGLILQIMPWPAIISMFKPNWALLILIYWNLALPHRAGMGTAFIMGLILDLFSGSVLGVHAFVLSVIAYLVIFKFQLVRNLALWQQSLIIVLLSICYDLVLFIIEIVMNHSITMTPLLFLSCLVNGLLWVWMFLLLRFIRRRFWIT
ncbi:rod shape-determining protein MreD [Zophobihabitans entericus]|uniref:Rod shape-determining protein MreD n=1 Tax=Zophobihabitans entericus TaxID=1635327 RepID=A0A6G9IDR6_9GAMM|nr:rod shape-determining protein MreD [Zophobihabitans entericus]